MGVGGGFSLALLVGQTKLLLLGSFGLVLAASEPDS